MPESEQQFRLLVESLPEMIWMSAADCSCFYFNRRWLEYTGRALEQERGQGWLESVHPEDRDRCARACAAASAAHNAFELEYRLRRADGEYRWIHNAVRPWFSAGSVFAGFVGSAVDMTVRRAEQTALRDSEECFRQLAETVDRVFWFATGDRQRMLYVSPAFERLWGITPAELYQNPHLWVEKVHPEDREQVERVFAAWGRRESREPEIEYRVVGNDGLTRWINDHCTPIVDERGALARLGGIAEDVTARKQAAAERERLQRQLQQAGKMEAISHLTGGIAHDFNNILATIIGYTDLALARFVTDKRSKLARYLEEVRLAGERARHLIDQMLAFSRGSGKPSRPYRLGALVEEAVNQLSSTLPPDIELKLQLEGPSPTVMTDSVQLHQMVASLCHNARDAMDGKGRIEVSVRTVPGLDTECDSCHARVRGDFVELRVGDTGAGVSDELRERMFEPFYTTKDTVSGSGMGLSIVHGIIHDQGGHISVVSAPGQGSTFSLLFPLSKDVLMPGGQGAPSSAADG